MYVQNKKALGLAFAIAGALFVSILAPLFIKPQIANAITPAELTQCFNRFDTTAGGKDGIIGGTLNPTDRALFQKCVYDNKACYSTGPGKTPDSLNYTCVNGAAVNAGAAAQAAVYQPFVTLVCGDNSGANAYAYSICQPGAQSDLDSCLYSGYTGGTDQTKQFSQPDIVATCLQTKYPTKYGKYSKAEITNAVQQGQDGYLGAYSDSLQQAAMDACTQSGKTYTLDPTTGAGSCTDASNTFECNWSGNPLTWFACPLVTGAVEMIKQLDSFLQDALTFDTAKVFDSTQTGYYKAWSSFRILATALIVIAGVTMVAAQALGFEFLDAYTIRKTLPRLFIAIIGISLSWPLMRLGIDFFNTLGLDVRQLIQAPFASLAKGDLSGSTLLAANVGLLTAGITLGIMGSLSFAVTAALALLIGFALIIFRDLALILIIITAPVAIAAYILPNTQKVWKLWKDNFIGLLVVFPIIQAFIATGWVFSLISSGPDGPPTQATGGATIAQIIGFVALFAPYFLLPLAFRLATGIIGTIAGFANDRGRGAFDRLKKYRGTRMADRVQRAQNNQLWDPNTAIGRRANSIAGVLTDPVGNAAYYGKNIPGLRKRGYKIASQIEHAQVEQTGKAFEEINSMGFNDKGLRALSGIHGEVGKEGGMSEGAKRALYDRGLLGKAPKTIKDIEAMADVLAEHGDDAEKLAANALHGSMGRIATMYQDPEMGKASIAGAGIMGLAAHGFATSEDLANAGNVLQKEGNAASAQSIISKAQQLGARSRPDTKPGYGVMYDPKANNGKGAFVDGLVGNENVKSRARSLVKSLGSHDLAGAKGGAFDALAPTIKDMLNEEHPDYNANEARAVEDQLFSWSGPYSQASVDVKAKSLKFMEGRSERATRTRKVRDADGTTREVSYEGWKEGSMMDRFESYSRRESNPETRGGGGTPGGGGDES